MNKLFDKIMDIEHLVKYLMACGIGINMFIAVWIISKIIRFTAGL